MYVLSFGLKETWFIMNLSMETKHKHNTMTTKFTNTDEHHFPGPKSRKPSKSKRKPTTSESQNLELLINV